MWDPSLVSNVPNADLVNFFVKKVQTGREVGSKCLFEHVFSLEYFVENPTFWAILNCIIIRSLGICRESKWCQTGSNCSPCMWAQCLIEGILLLSFGPYYPTKYRRLFELSQQLGPMQWLETAKSEGVCLSKVPSKLQVEMHNRSPSQWLPHNLAVFETSKKRSKKDTTLVAHQPNLTLF